jgi:hypothetical protein
MGTFATVLSVLNSERSSLNLIAMLITDIALLVIMLVGLLRVRTSGGGTFGLSKLLWKQVGVTALPDRSYFNSSICCLFRKGVIWLLIAIAAEVPPVVSQTSFSLLSVSFIRCTRCSLP